MMRLRIKSGRAGFCFYAKHIKTKVKTWQKYGKYQLGIAIFGKRKYNLTIN